MNRPALHPAQIIEAARQRLAKATSAEGIQFEAYTAIGMVETLLDLGLIDRNTWSATRAEFDRIEGDRRKRLEGARATSRHPLAGASVPGGIEDQQAAEFLELFRALPERDKAAILRFRLELAAPDSQPVPARAESAARDTLEN